MIYDFFYVAKLQLIGILAHQLLQRFPNCGSRSQLGSICNLSGVALQFAWGRLTICLGSPRSRIWLLFFFACHFEKMFLKKT